LTPVIFITAKDGLEHKLNGLSLGADDYIVKPFEMLELLARIETVLRRTQKNNTTFSLGNVDVSMTDRTVNVNGKEADLSPQEFELLEVLIRNQNIALSRDKLLELFWFFVRNLFMLWLRHRRSNSVFTFCVPLVRKRVKWRSCFSTLNAPSD